MTNLLLLMKHNFLDMNACCKKKDFYFNFKLENVFNAKALDLEILTQTKDSVLCFNKWGKIWTSQSLISI